MATEIKVPTLGESLTEATVATWFKSVGDAAAADEPLLELETDKVTVEVNAPEAGTLLEINAEEGAEVEVGALLGSIGAGSGKAAAKPAPAKKEAPTPAPAPHLEETQHALSPAVRKLIEEKHLDPAIIPATGRGGRLTKGDVLDYLQGAPAPAAPPKAANPGEAVHQIPGHPAGPREERVPMTRLRRRIAERLKEAQNTAAMLTTFNEVDMSAVMEMRARYRDDFEKKHGVRVGFMSFFVKASIVALQDIPAVNAEIDGDDLVYKDHYDIGIAVGTGAGLVVPVLRDADRLSFAGVEKSIGEMGRRARDGKLGLEEMAGGTFTITNGGIYGSMLSTPILNPPQSGILGMHNIVERAVVVDGEITVRPMMYLALSYDHRIVDGREAVSFLVRI